MRTPIGISLIVIALGLSPTAPSLAAPRSPVDARVRALFAHRDATGRTLPFYRARRSFERSGLAPLLVRFAREPSPRELARYRKLGFEMGRKLLSGASKVLARPEAIDAMEGDGVLERVTVDLPPAIVAEPLDEITHELGAAAGIAAWHRAHGTPLTGKGVVVGNVDSSMDPFQPAFFEALPPERWFDVDGDNALTPGVDGVDRDGNGTIEPREVLRHLDGNATDLFLTADRLYGTQNVGFDPGWDYLFFDENGDGKRNAGSEVAGADALPSMGEPVFAADDVNRDGRITTPERIVPLGQSKFRALQRGNQIYRRGENLSQYVPAIVQTGHGTRMMAAVGGGQPGISRFLGLAPQAELLATDTHALPSLTDGVQWLIDEGAQVILTEWGWWGFEPSDGSTETELLLDAAVEQNKAVVVSPAGNLGYSHKHASAVIPAARALEPYQNEIELEDIPNRINISITWREGTVGLTGSLTTPDGDMIDLGALTPAASTMNGRGYSVVPGTTPLGAGYVLLSLGPAGPPLPATGSVLTLKTDGDTAANAALYAIDDASLWVGGAGFADSHIEGCMNSPAFASRAIAVSAYAFHAGPGFTPYPESSGALRGFSGRGPDLWGDRGIDIAAPDNPVSPTTDNYPNGVGEGLFVHYSESGGTSGAGAVTAGMAALFREAYPELSAMELRDQIIAAARTDAQVEAGSPEEWGAGKLDLGLDEAAGTPPTAQLQAPELAAPGQSIELVVALADDGDVIAARTRWDFDYDGTWDTSWIDGLSTTTTMPEGVEHVDVKVEAMDADGWVASAVARIGKGDPPVTPPPPLEAEDDAGCGCRIGSRALPRATFALLLGAALALVRRRFNAVSRRSSGSR